MSAASELGSIVTMRAKSSLQPSSILTYQRAWRIFYQFRNAIFHSVCPINIGSFYCLYVQQKVCSVYCKLICFCIRLFPIFALGYSHFQYSTESLNLRQASYFPVSMCQFQAMCLTTFFAFLRIGEITYNSPKDAGAP